MGRANLEGTVLSKAKLSHANLKRGNLNNANLQMANLTDAALRLADLNRVKLSLKTWYLMGAGHSAPELALPFASDANPAPKIPCNRRRRGPYNRGDGSAAGLANIPPEGG